jgi:BirA family transcriptional regulator, biotin operon repressor / biotin---[acetyl-CoA-carboxylase] ligase
MTPLPLRWARPHGEPVDVLRQDSLEDAARAAGIDVRPRFLDETGSTNAVAGDLAARGAPEWTLVAAGHQTAGRGRLGRSWTSAPGRSLLFSLVLRPPLPPEEAPVVSLLAAAILAECSPTVRPGPIATKWPNDLMAGERKVGGILPEARVEGSVVSHVVLGIGLNVGLREDDLPEPLRATASSLAIEGAEVSMEELLSCFLTGFRAAYHPADPSFGTLAVSRYRARCATIGRRVRASTVDGRVVEGTATGIDDRGGLVVEGDGAPRVVAFGEIEHLN